MARHFVVTVLIPCHSLNYLSKCIESISLQTMDRNKFEILLIADRIDEQEAKSILNKFGLNHRVVVSEQSGIVAALNLGLSLITSEFIARMDEDDLMVPNRLELQYQYLRKHKKTVVVGGQIDLIDVSDKTIGYSKYRKNVRKRTSQLFDASPIAHPTAMIRRSAIEKIGGYRDFLPEDWDLWVRLREVGLIKNLKHTVLSYRIHPEQLSREKMYVQNLARQLVAASYFARDLGIKDSPELGDDKYNWLQKTQNQLRTSSVDFCRFEKKWIRNEIIISTIKNKDKLEYPRIIIQLFLKYPTETLSFLFTKVGRRIQHMWR